jgi:outer membrane lipoprotein SlyB
MTEDRVVERETVTEQAVEPHGTVEKDLAMGVPHGDEEAGGAFLGGAAGAVAGAIVGGPVGAVVGGAIGAAAGTTAGAVDEKAKDDTVVVTREVRR